MKIYILTETSIKSYQSDCLRVNKNHLVECCWDNGKKQYVSRNIDISKDEKSAKYILKRIFGKVKNGEYCIDWHDIML